MSTWKNRFEILPRSNRQRHEQEGATSAWWCRPQLNGETGKWWRYAADHCSRNGWPSRLFEAAIYRLQVNHKLMLHCANPLCEAPYFSKADNAKRQTHCSPECADLARRTAKLKWWNENRKKNRNQK